MKSYQRAKIIFYSNNQLRYIHTDLFFFNILCEETIFHYKVIVHLGGADYHFPRNSTLVKLDKIKQVHIVISRLVISSSSPSFASSNPMKRESTQCTFGCTHRIRNDSPVARKVSKPIIIQIDEINKNNCAVLSRDVSNNRKKL